MINFGSIAKQRAISQRRRSPPERRSPRFLRTFSNRNSWIRLFHLISSCFDSFVISKTLIILSSHSSYGRHSASLWKIANTSTSTLINREVGNFLIVNIDMSLIRNHQSCCHIKRVVFSCTIWSEQPHNLTLLHIDAHTIGNSTLSVSLPVSLYEEYFPLLGVQQYYLILT